MGEKAIFFAKNEQRAPQYTSQHRTKIKDYAEANKWFRKAAEQGLADAQYNLGSAYCRGHGVKQDYASA